MTFKITKSNNNQILVKAESWLDLLKSLSNEVVKIERLDKVSQKVRNKE